MLGVKKGGLIVVARDSMQPVISSVVLISVGACGIPADGLFGTVDAGHVCLAGATRCASTKPGVIETCVPEDAGKAEDGGSGSWSSQSCDAGDFCWADAGCAPCPEPCQPGAVRCSPDAKDVLACSQDAETGCLMFLPATNCPAIGMATCEMPDPGTILGAVQDYCVNACGGRGVALLAQPCDPAPNMPCSFLVCDTNAHALVSDHTACLGGGFDCGANSDCASCRCTGGKCVGGMRASCSAACM